MKRAVTIFAMLLAVGCATYKSIGAGDAFSGALIAARLQNRGWPDALRFATAASALKHSIPGDFCLVTSTEVEQLVNGPSLRVSR